jgi:hypothetical protein
LLLIKPMNDTTHRAVFTNEMGFKFFDFEFSGSDNFKVIYIMESMNKNYIINLLKRDLELLLPKKINLPNINQYENQNNVYLRQPLHGNESLYYIFNKNCTQLLRIEHAKKNKIKTTAFIHSYETTVMDSVFIKHHGLKLSLAFKKIEQHAAE